MATRRAGDLQFDHGAQYFTARGERFRAAALALPETARGVWRGQGRDDERDEDFVGRPGMSGFARALGQGLEVVCSRQIVALEPRGSSWRLHDADGPVAGPDGEPETFDAALLAVPAPQAAPLARTCGVDLPALAAARYAPCWAVMAAFERTVAGAPDRARSDDPVLPWFARDSSKPGRPAAETFVLHAAPDWTREHLEAPAEEVVRLLLARFAEATGADDAPFFASAHRWRYALVERAAGVPFAWEGAARLGACGDWALGARVECAFDSGDALGVAVAHALGGRS
jgi:predicted NAD/FAD-dependent oxidoreductase